LITRNTRDALDAALGTIDTCGIPEALGISLLLETQEYIKVYRHNYINIRKR